MKKRYLLLPVACALAAIGSVRAQTLPCTNPINSFPYSENFDAGPGGWTAAASSADWTLGTPAKSTINSAFSGANSWITAGLTGSYTDNAEGSVVSPCFNFSSLTLPIIELKVWWEMEFSWDGVVLQSSIDGGNTWQNVGASGDPNNWFNDNTIGGEPGGQQEGWTGRTDTGDGSNGWVTAKHNLTGLAGQSNVRLRLAFASDGSGVDDGFAFDNIQIYQPSAIDVGIAAITVPGTGSTCSANPISVTIQLQNFGSAAQSNIPVSYTVNGGTPVTGTFAGPLAPGATATYTFPTTYTPAGNGTYTFAATSNLAGDGNANNNAAPSNPAVTIITPIASFPYNQNFDNGAGGWTSGGTASSWALGTPAKSVINSAFSGPNSWITGLTAPYNNNENSYVLSPCFDFSSLGLPTVEFKLWWQTETSFDGAVLQSSIDGGATWQNVGAVGDPDNWYNDNTISGEPGGQQDGWTGNGGGFPAIPGSGGWVTVKHVLTGLANRPSVRLRVAFGSEVSGTDDGIAFDNFQIYQPSAIDLGVAAITTPLTGASCSSNPLSVSVRIQNFGSATQSNIPVSYTVNGGTPVTGTFAGPLAPGATAVFTFPTQFNPGGQGTFVFAATTSMPGDGNSTNDAAQNTTLTIVTPITAFPYTQNFESGTAGWSTGGAASSWALGEPAKATISGAASGSNAWVTGLTTEYNNNENSYVVSPCFDFSSLGLPSVEMQIWWDSDSGNDGTVFQSSIDGGATWQTIGTVGDPDNWYNDGSIGANPGGQTSGWTGDGGGFPPISGSGTYVMASHTLPQLANQPSVRFRFAFASDGFTTADGFAFDDFKIVGLTPPPPPAVNDLTIAAIAQPTSSCTLTNSELVTVVVSNRGTAPQSNFAVTVNYTPPTGPVRTLTTTYTGTLAPNTSQPIFFTRAQDLSARGCYNFTAYATLASDQVRSNDTARAEVCNLLIAVTPAAPYQQTFETTTGGWSAKGGTWALGTPVKSTIQGAASGTKAWVTGGLSTGRYNDLENSSVESPCFDLTALTDPVIELKLWFRTEANRDGASLQFTADGGATWTTIGTTADPSWYNNATIAAQPGGGSQGWSGSNGSYMLYRHSLAGTTAVGQPSVRFRVAFAATSANPPATNDVDDGVAFDDVAIYQRPSTDVSVVGILPVGSACGFTTNEQIQVRVKNLGTTAITSLPISYQLGSNPAVSTTANVTLLPDTEGIVVFPQTANLTTAQCYDLTLTTNLAGDQLGFNNALTVRLCNTQSNTIPTNVDFDAAGSTIDRLTLQTQSLSRIALAPTRGTNTSTALLMTGGGSNWIDPLGPGANPWQLNPDHLAIATLCVKPANLPAGSPIRLAFNLRQVSNGAAALFSNTNFRVLVNGTVVGDANYQPNPASPATGSYRYLSFDITRFRVGTNNIIVQFQSSVNRNFGSSLGDANFIDNITIDGAVGFGMESAFAQGVSVFPNPSNGVFRVALDHEGARAYSLVVTDLSGRTVAKQHLNSTGHAETEMDLTKLARGVYVLKVTDADGNLSVRKLNLE
jgi:Secretion system C-terminal sorting domain/CARDB